MSQQNALWQPLGRDMPLVSTALPLKVDLLPATYGQLRLQCVNGAFPKGGLLLVLSNWPETGHWYVPARLEGGILTAELSGAEAAYDPEESRPLLAFLAEQVEGGLKQYPLLSSRPLSRFQPVNHCAYLFDDRELWGGPAASFYRGEILYEVVPHFAQTEKKKVSLVLSMLPRSLRYWQQMSYGLLGMTVKEETLLLAAKKPEGAPDLEGFSIHRLNGEAEGQQFIPGQPREEGCWGAIRMEKLPMDGQRYALSGVLHTEDGVLYHVPLAVISPKIHQAMEYLANGTPLRREGEQGCYLELDDLCRPTLMSGKRPPVCQDGGPGLGLRQMLEQELLPVVGHCAIRNLGGQNWHWRFELPGYELTAQDEIVLRAINKGSWLVFPVEVLSYTAGRSLLSADLSALAGALQNSLITYWQLSLAIRQRDTYYHMKLRIPEQTVRRGLDTDAVYLNYTFAFNEPVGTVPLGEQTVEALICCPSNGYCQIQTADRIRRYERQLTCRSEKVQLRGTHLRLKVCCPNTVPGKWTSIALVHRYKLEPDRQIFFCPVKHIRRQEETWLAADIDLSRLQFSPLYWDIRAVFEGPDGVPRLVRIRPRLQKEDSKTKKKLHRHGKRWERAFFSGSYRQGEDLSVSLYQTTNNQFALVCQEYSPYSGLRFRIKERCALILSRLFGKQLAQKHIFLCYEKYCCMAQDNGFYFFRHCMENDMERRMNRSIYFVIDKKQPDYQEHLLPYKDHVIQFMSLKHMVYLLAARLLISSDSKAHAYAWRAKESIILPRVMNQKKLVFLQHGVIALKRVEFYSKGSNAVNLFVTSNQREHDIIVNEMAYPTEDVIITGLARWDVLEDKRLKERHILVMPTWRNWLEEVSDVVFMASDYYRNYMSLLNDARLSRLLEEQDLYLDFYIHPKFREYLSDFSVSNGDRVRMIPFGAEPLNQLIMGCKLLITDYSSVCWDVYYQGKPVLFYQFDVDKYNETTGSYIDMETELFGDRVMTTEELLAQLEAYAKGGFRLPEKYAEMRPHMYAYLDHNNSQRTCEEIMKRNW
ncbi:MAG: CDP-glycerol glycerophosphotransferase family protein [Candidatus Onthomonas sp.]